MKNRYQIQRDQQEGKAQKPKPAKAQPARSAAPDAKTFNAAGTQARGGQLIDALKGLYHGVTFGLDDGNGLAKLIPSTQPIAGDLAAAQKRNGLAFGLGQSLGVTFNPLAWSGGTFLLKGAKKTLEDEKAAGGLLALREAARRGKRNIPGDALSGRRLNTGDPDRIRAARRHLDRMAAGLGGSHGAALGAGGIEVDTPEHKRSPIEVLKESLLGGAVGAAVARSAPAAIDAAPLLLGKPRLSAPKQLSLPPGRSVDDLLAAATAEQEAMFRASGMQPRFARAGQFGAHEVSPQTEQNPITQQLLALAARSPAGQERIANAGRRLGQLEEVRDVRSVRDRLAGLRVAQSDLKKVYGQTGREKSPGLSRLQPLDTQVVGQAYQVPSPALPPYRRQALARTPLEDPSLHPSWMREVAGPTRPDAPDTHQPLRDWDRQILGTSVLARLQGQGPVRTREDAQRISAMLDQPHLREAMRTLGIRQAQPFSDPTGPERKRLARQIRQLQTLSAAPDTDLGAGYTAANQPRPARIMDTQDAIRETGGRLEDSLAQGLLDRRTSPRNVYDPQLPSSDEPLLTVTRERGPVDWVNSLPPSALSDRLAAAAALGADYGVHGAEDALLAMISDILDAPMEANDLGNGQRKTQRGAR